MFSTKVQERKIIPKNPFTNSLTPYQHYLNQLEINIHQLKQKFPFEQSSKIRSLLEELDNSVQMVQEILREESAKQAPMKKQFTNNKKLSTKEQNIILKRAFINLYKKMIKKDKENQQIIDKYEKIKRENQHLKMENQCLLYREYYSNEIKQNPDIY